MARRRNLNARSVVPFAEPLASPNTRTDGACGASPGVSKENISLEAEGQVLRLSVRQEEEKEDKSGDTWHRVERSSAFQTRSLRMPDDADLGQVKADLDSGVLRVSINKRPEAEASKRKQIKVA